jgi:hypothetical protein
MRLKRGDVVKVLAGGVFPPGAHPIVILTVLGDTAIISNITDIENEDDVHCLIEPKDDPKIITINSTFRYQSIKEQSVTKIEQAIIAGGLRYCGQLASIAFNKIIAGSQLPGVIIKPKYKEILKPAPSIVVKTQAIPTVEISGE